VSSDTQSGTTEDGDHRLLCSQVNDFVGWPSVNLNPALQVAIHSKPLSSDGRQFNAPFDGGLRSQSTQGVACTETYNLYIRII